MARVLIRDLPDDVMKRLKMRAASKGHSLERELRDVVVAAAPLATEEKLAIIDRIRSQNPKMAVRDSTDIIREERDKR
jgi:plasmid stability protein